MIPTNTTEPLPVKKVDFEAWLHKLIMQTLLPDRPRVRRPESAPMERRPTIWA